MNDLADSTNKINSGIEGPADSGDYYTEANSVFTISNPPTMIIIQNTISYSTSLSTIITDVNQQPEALYSKDIEISAGLAISKIIEEIIV